MKKLIFKEDIKDKPIETIRFPKKYYYYIDYLKLIQIEMKKHNINASIKERLHTVYLYKII